MMKNTLKVFTLSACNSFNHCKHILSIKFISLPIYHIELTTQKFDRLYILHSNIDPEGAKLPRRRQFALARKESPPKREHSFSVSNDREIRTRKGRMSANDAN